MHANRVVESRSCGGCLETSAAADGRPGDPREASEFEGGVLLLETSEELPSGAEVSRTLRNMGERGPLWVSAVLVKGTLRRWRRCSATGTDRGPWP